ncbi:hypothetical protein DM860_009911 [Cuscuta australis]|uniref:RIN4 pathogenic type III effector avirulence factor Avr cleavage site domain-containing protein n=1 Tax=Cuscuta australis TaxID=267555 RepID=A0A328DFY4_9ASTE|nr:hypothetical protein DM860_009911 [Cuscuta australis]
MQRNGRTAVPKFGGWDDKSGNSPSNYTVMFSEARANRKQQKKDFTRHSLGNEQELRAKQHQMEVESVRYLCPSFLLCNTIGIVTVRKGRESFQKG